MHRRIIYIPVLAGLSLAYACTDAKPTATPSKAAAPTSTATFTPVSTPVDTGVATSTVTSTGSNIDLTPNCDASKDYFQLDYPQNVKDCLAQGKMYNFTSNQCTTMTRASFDCTYASLATEMTNLELDPSALQSPQSKGLKLINCGVSNDGFTIVAQFWRQSTVPGQKACTYAGPSTISAICYRKFVTETAPSAAGTDPTNCMQANPQ